MNLRLPPVRLVLGLVLAILGVLFAAGGCGQGGGT